MSVKKIDEFPDLPTSVSLESNKKVISELQRVNPSQIVTLFEVDAEDLLLDQHVPFDRITKSDAVFRFHNNLKLSKQDIIWKGQKYIALPIIVQGYEANTKGSAPSPKLSLFSDATRVEEFKNFKLLLRKANDLTGAKVTRIKTFAKYLDEDNFYINIGGRKNYIGDQSLVPDGFEPDPNAEFPREIYFVERKSVETANSIEFELSSFVDFENKNLPNRLVISRSCQFEYRGEGCLYEYAQNFSPNDAPNRGKAQAAFNCDSLKSLNLPSKAPPIADSQNTLIKDVIPEYDFNKMSRPPVKWSESEVYFKGDFVYIEKSGRKYYFVAKSNDIPKGIIDQYAAPPNLTYWVQDSCSKDAVGCKLRWSDEYKDQKGLRVGGEFSTGSITRTDSAAVPGNGKTHDGHLPFGGFPATIRLEEGS